MLARKLQEMLRRRRRINRRRQDAPRAGRDFETLENRAVPAVMGLFSAGAGILTIVGDMQDNDIVIRRQSQSSR